MGVRGVDAAAAVSYRIGVGFSGQCHQAAISRQGLQADQDVASTAVSAGESLTGGEPLCLEMNHSVRTRVTVWR